MSKGDKLIEEVPLKWLSTFYHDMPLGYRFFLLEVHKMKKRDKKGKPLKTKIGRYMYYIPEPKDVVEEQIAKMKAF